MSLVYPIHSIKSAQAYEDSILGDDPEKIASAMENAGRSIGAELLKDYQEIRPWPVHPEVLVLAGKGLNTGDALVACETLHAAVPGLRVTLVLTEEAANLNPIAKSALERLKKAMGEAMLSHTSESFTKALSGPFDVVIDGLYGHGFRPPLKEAATQLLQYVNSHEAISLRVSIDIPSGMGDETDTNAFRADITYIPGVAKEPCVRHENLAWTGRIRFLEIEPFLNQKLEQPGQTGIVSRNAYKSRNRLRPAQTDKRHYGHCLILAGSNLMPGAALMATMGALNAGAGLVTTFVPATIATQIAAKIPEAMWRPCPINPEGGLDAETVRMVSSMTSKAHALLIGPGLLLTRSTIFSLCRIIREVHLPLVIDASALTQDIVASVLGRPLTAGPVVLTPHPGEYFRMNGLKEHSVSDESLIEFSRKHRAITVLKGSPTRISDGQSVFLAPVGGPVLSRGGAGDILSGMLTSLLAQTPEDPLGAAIAATTWHGAAGDSLARERGAIAVRTTEMLGHLATVLRA